MLSSPSKSEEEASQSCFGKHSWQCDRVIPIPASYGYSRAKLEYDEYCDERGILVN